MRAGSGADQGPLCCTHPLTWHPRPKAGRRVRGACVRAHAARAGLPGAPRREQFAVLFYKNLLVNVRSYRATLLRLLSPL